MRRDQLNDTYLDLVDKQRLYFKTVKDFQEVCITKRFYTDLLILFKPLLKTTQYGVNN